MDKTDKRTGEVFPSVVRRDAIDSLASLSRSDSKAWARILETAEAAEIHTDKSNDWTLNLNPQSLQDFGAFERMVPYGHLSQADAESGVVERPLEWFQRVAQVIKDRMMADEALWQAINDIFDQAIDVANAELGFISEEDDE